MFLFQRNKGLLVVLFFLLVHSTKVQSTNFNINWLSTTVADNRELQTTTYTMVAKNDSTGTGDAQINSGAAGIIGLGGCVNAAYVTGGSINGVPITFGVSMTFTFPDTIPEGAMITFVINGISNGNEGTYSGTMNMSVIFNASNGFTNIQNASFTIVSYLPRSPVLPQGSNLVPNPGFETYSACPSGNSNISQAVP